MSYTVDEQREGLRLVKEREAKLRALQEHIDSAIAKGGENTEKDVISLKFKQG